MHLDPSVDKQAEQFPVHASNKYVPLFPQYPSGHESIFKQLGSSE